MKNYYEVDNMIVNLKEGYCLMKETGKKIPASEEVLTELLRSHWRMIKSEAKHHSKYLYYNAKTTDGTEYLDFISAPPTNNPEAIVSKKEFYSIMNEVIKNFPARTREVGQLYFFGGHTEKEIAEQLNISHQVVHYQKKLFSRKINENKKLVELYEEIYER